MMNWRLTAILMGVAIWLAQRAAGAQQLAADEAGPVPILAVEQADYYAQLLQQESATSEAEIAPGISPMMGAPMPGPTGGVLCEPASARACVFNSYWDITGGRRP